VIDLLEPLLPPVPGPWDWLDAIVCPVDDHFAPVDAETLLTEPHPSLEDWVQPA
jgi:hypothetical protein